MIKRKTAVQFPNKRHNHKACIADALNKADEYCHREGLRLTELRRQVLELVWGSHRPVGAYDLLQQITETGRKAAPPTVYRALEFLLDHHLIHRIDSMNAYLGCSQPGHEHNAQFFICKGCGEAAELVDRKIDNALSRDAENLGFEIEKRTIELTGTCGACRRRRKR
jgi:Fur family zinc uptake transcriptional regulator